MSLKPPVQLNDPQLADLLHGGSAISSLMIETMSIGPVIDPDAGYGALQAPVLYLQNNLTAEDDRLLLEVCPTALHLYVFLRAGSVGHPCLGRMRCGEPLDFVEMAFYTAMIILSYKADVVKQMLEPN